MFVVFIGNRVLMLLASRPRHITFLRTHLMFFFYRLFCQYSEDIEIHKHACRAETANPEAKGSR